MAQISGTGMGGSTVKKPDLTAVAKKVAGSTATTKVTKAAAEKKAPTPVAAKAPVTTAAKAVAKSAADTAAGWSTDAKKSRSVGGAPTTRSVKTTTVRPSGGMSGVGDGPSLGMLYDFMESPVYATRDIPVAGSRLAGQPMDHPGSEFPTYDSFLAAIAPSIVAQRPEGGLNSAKFYEREAAGGSFEGPVDWRGIAGAMGIGGEQGLNSPTYYERLAANGGEKPFEGVVDWGGILNAVTGQKQEPLSITIGGPGNTARTTLTAAEKAAIADPGFYRGTSAPIVAMNDPGMTWTEARRGLMTPVGYVPDRLMAEAPLAAIDAVAPPAALDPVGLPRRDPRGYASNDLFMSDGQVTLPDGSVVRPGVPAAKGLDAAVPAEPSAWDNVVDNTGKLLSNTGLGAIVSTLFPDIWNAGGDMMKGLATGAPAGPVRDMPNWDADRGTWKGSSGGDKKNKNGTTPPPAAFPDLNHNGIDDRVEGYTGPDTGTPTTPVPTPTPGNIRYVTFPTDGFRPGVDDEFRYFSGNPFAPTIQRLAEGGLVQGYADGGAVNADPRSEVIANAEDAIENYAAGTPEPDDEPALRAFVEMFGDAALRALAENVQGGMKMRGGSGGRMISGPGGPKDDAVPAVIVDEAGAGRPAALSDGEFVFPAEAVDGAGGPEAMQQLSAMLANRA